ncbi:MAG: ABC transporter ATP-binding protein, partial [Lachnospiraceae bacterium]|nr:ABC transporter ATP-binding protein [Lachnospiraceae bacterium]
LALSIRKTPVSEIEKKIKEIAGKLEIEDVLAKYPYQMSGGQKQRVAAARAVINKPKLILADEPTGALDSKAARMLLDSLQTLNKELGATILMVTHDAFTASYASTIIFIKDGKVFTELSKEEGESRKNFFERIIHVMTLLGGELNELV